MRLRLAGPVALAWVLVCFAIVYGGDIGRGFIKDDFSWILHSPLHAAGDVPRAFTDTPMGFYRPLVAISFGVDERLFGLAPRGYAWTNFVVAAGVALLVAATAASMGFGRLGGAWAAALWAFNLHGINMALLWVSGRTSLLGAFGAALAALAFTRRRFLLAGACTLVALLGKEEPLLLPLVFALWTALDARAEDRDGRRAGAAIARATWPSFLAVTIYLLIRSQTLAFTPATAPDVYQLRPSAILANALPYLDRSLTFTTAALTLAWLVFSRRTPVLDALERRTVAKGLVWLVLGFALSIMVASRSSLYAVLPSIGSAIAGVAVGRAIWRTIPPRRAAVAVGAALALPLALWPVYHARNQRLKDEAILSSAILATIHEHLAARPDVSRIVVFDDPAARPSATSALGEKLDDAVRLTAGRALPATIVPDAVLPAIASPDTLELLVERGTVVARPITPPPADGLAGR